MFCFCWGSVNEWMRRKGEDGIGGKGGVYVGLYVGGRGL